MEENNYFSQEKMSRLLQKFAIPQHAGSDYFLPLQHCESDLRGQRREIPG